MGEHWCVHRCCSAAIHLHIGKLRGFFVFLMMGWVFFPEKLLLGSCKLPSWIVNVFPLQFREAIFCLLCCCHWSTVLDMAGTYSIPDTSPFSKGRCWSNSVVKGFPQITPFHPQFILPASHRSLTRRNTPPSGKRGSFFPLFYQMKVEGRSSRMT